MDGLSVWACAWLHGTVVVPLIDEATRTRWPGWRARRIALVVLLSPLVVAAAMVQEHDKVMRGVVALAGPFYALRACQVVCEPRFMREPLLRRQVVEWARQPARRGSRARLAALGGSRSTR